MKFFLSNHECADARGAGYPHTERSEPPSHSILPTTPNRRMLEARKVQPLTRFTVDQALSMARLCL